METKQEMLRALIEAGYTKRAIAARVGVSSPTIRRWLEGNGTRDPKAFERLRRMYRAAFASEVKHD